MTAEGCAVDLPSEGLFLPKGYSSFYQRSFRLQCAVGTAETRISQGAENHVCGVFSVEQGSYRSSPRLGEREGRLKEKSIRVCFLLM